MSLRLAVSPTTTGVIPTARESSRGSQLPVPGRHTLTPELERHGSDALRIAIVTPYSWTYAGGVNRHVEALAEALIDRGHEVRVLAPWDPPDRLSRALHRAEPSGEAAPTT